jgi:peroxiredoxin Q/BCP
VARIVPKAASFTESRRYDARKENPMLKHILAGLAVVLVVASVLLWMLRAGGQRPVGSAAPDFALPDQAGQTHRLGDYAGRWLVLYFYPKDDTPGCTQQACSLRDDIGSLNELGAAVVGVSVDDVASHAEFARKFSLPFPLLADTKGKTAAAYGSLLNLGVARFARRHTFIIDPEGRIAARFDKVDTARHAAEVAQTLRQLQGART